MEQTDRPDFDAMALDRRLKRATWLGGTALALSGTIALGMMVNATVGPIRISVGEATPETVSGAQEEHGYAPVQPAIAPVTPNDVRVSVTEGKTFAYDASANIWFSFDSNRRLSKCRNLPYHRQRSPNL